MSVSMTTATAGSLLIVDDEPSVRHALERLLRREGYEIHSAADAADADRILNAKPIDVILCDQDMPGVTGIEFLLKAAQQYPHQRRLMISGRFQSGDVAKAMDAGAIHKFMMKPWDDAILKADIRASFRQIMTDFAAGTGHDTHGGNERREAANLPDDGAWVQFEEDRRLSRELHSAAADGSLSLAYQPQIRLRDDTVCGFEALLRWTATSGPVGADRFIGLAERGGSISKLTHWVFREVCHRTRQWLNGWPDARVALNVSPVDLRDDALIDHVAAMLERYAIPATAIQVEVTESQALKCDDTMLARLTKLADIGMNLAIDDFGAGATTLSYLAGLPFAILKLDRSLTQQLTDDKGFRVVQKVLEMAHCLGMKTTVEGIETAEQAGLARSLGADTAQGFHFARPGTRQDVQRWIAAGCSGVPQ